MVVQDDLKEFGDAADLKKNLEHSVFNNPFRVKEEKKKAILERHVEMTTKQEDRRTIEGKKVCWNFRKGRCRFGSKCTFAHDSDVKQRPNSETVSPKSQPLSSSIREEEPENPEAVIENNKRITKKRPGVSDSLTLGKKAMKFHDKVYGNSNK
jgi:phage terminase large subunit GpA-like protein